MLWTVYFLYFSAYLFSSVRLFSACQKPVFEPVRVLRFVLLIGKWTQALSVLCFPSYINNTDRTWLQPFFIWNCKWTKRKCQCQFYRISLSRPSNSDDECSLGSEFCLKSLLHHCFKTFASLYIISTYFPSLSFFFLAPRPIKLSLRRGPKRRMRLRANIHKWLQRGD